MYVSLGTAPTRDTYQYRYTSTGADQTLALAAQPGTYYILVYNNLVNSPGSTYTLHVQGGPFALTGLTPGQVGNGKAATLLVTGVFPLAYQSATAYQIQFVSAGGTVYPASPLYLSPTSLGANSGGSQNVNGTMTMSATLPANTLAGRHLLGAHHRQPGQHADVAQRPDGDGRRHRGLEDQHQHARPDRLPRALDHLRDSTATSARRRWPPRSWC